jgi:hypothetical protein
MPRERSAACAQVPHHAEELPPLAFDPHWAQPIKVREAGFWNGHWPGFVFLLPFLVMLVVHELLGMSDALFAGNDPRDDGARLYNLLMITALYLGSLAFIVHAFSLPILKGQGWRWILPKLIFLAVYWGAIMVAANFLGK